MADVVFLLLLAGFFCVAGLLVKGCERIIGPEQVLLPDSSVPDPSVPGAGDEAVAA